MGPVLCPRGPEPAPLPRRILAGETPLMPDGQRQNHRDRAALPPGVAMLPLSWRTGPDNPNCWPWLCLLSWLPAQRCTYSLIIIGSTLGHKTRSSQPYTGISPRLASPRVRQYACSSIPVIMALYTKSHCCHRLPAHYWTLLACGSYAV